MPDTRAVRLRVARVIAETEDAVSVEFEAPPDFSYRPGQFLTLRVPSDRTGSVARCYSLSSSPDTDDRPKVTVKRTVDGYGSNWVCDNVAEGSELDVLPPAGVFTPASLDDDLLLCAGGSGITPVMSIVKSALARGSGQVVLVYANRDERSVIFAEELRELAARYPDRLVVMHWLESLQGLPTARHLRTLAAYPGYQAFICGPAPFMDVCVHALREAGVPRERIHVEKFRSLVDNPFERDDAADTVTDDGSADQPASVEVELDGETHRFPWPRGRRLLDLFLEKGLDAPYSCREGACSACACRVTSGEVKMVNNEVLDSEDLDDGIILACQSLPVTDEVKVTYT
jgi:3-ketosteroid 9alpha-monooxygenase subunit B